MGDNSVYIYAIGRAEGPVKIGISAYPYGRVFDLQAGCPFEISVLYTRACLNRVSALRHEQTVHAVYAEKRLMREWFDIDAEMAKEAIDAAIELAESFAGHEGAA